MFVYFLHSPCVLSQVVITQTPNPDSTSIKQNEKKSNFFQQEELKLKDLGKYLHRNHLGLSITIPQLDSDAVNYAQPNFEGTFGMDQLRGFKDSYSFLMKSEYKNLFKYDLGVVGKYLGISKNILAIILAIISVAK